MVWYGLATYLSNGNGRSALVLEKGSFDLEDIYSRVGEDSGDSPDWIHDVTVIITRWTEIHKDLYNLAHEANRLVLKEKLAPLEIGDQELLAPFKPNRIFGAASNYIEHANEMETVLAAKAESNPIRVYESNLQCDR